MAKESYQDSLEQIAGEQNHYIYHLAEVNNKNGVITADDIRNENGFLLIPRGTHLSQHIAERILQHKLPSPLENHVYIEHPLTAHGIGKGIHAMLDKYPDMMQIHSASGSQSELDHLLEKELHPVLAQKLTVMKEELPSEYEKALFCAWLSTLIAAELGFSSSSFRSVFLAGLAHDIGLLHISPEIIYKKGKLTANQWQVVQSHVIISHLLFKKIEGASSRSARSVLEHHERCDGSGYPAGKTGDQLDSMGQIIGLADSIQSIRFKQFERLGRNLGDTGPYIQLNASSYSENVTGAMLAILQKSGLRPSVINPLGDMNKMIYHLLDRGRKLQNAVALLDEAQRIVKIEQGDLNIKLINTINPISQMVTSSGLVENEFFNWLEELQKNMDESALENLVGRELMQNELYWQLKKACIIINEYMDKNAPYLSQEHKKELAQIAVWFNRLFAESSKPVQ
ncbi:MAG: HD domain-containing protein [Nitrospirae bacterium]|nr:HD domain-containing protein [Nitrospirota bacterium]